MRLGLKTCLALLVTLSMSAGRTFQTEIPRERVRPAVRRGDFVYVSATAPADESGKIPPGDAAEQTGRVLDSIGRTLRAMGSSLESAASVQVYLRRASDFQAMNDVYRRYWSTDPPVRTTVVADLGDPDALVEISLTALVQGRERKVIHPPHWMASPNPYSYGILSGDTLFLAGLVSRNGKDNSIVTGDIKTQTVTILKNAGEILAAAGMSHADVVSSRVFITDTRNFQAMNMAYRDFFPAQPPARATVRTELTSRQYLVEIALTAVQGQKQVFNTPDPDGTPGRENPNLSAAVVAGNRIFLSGMLGITDSNSGDAASQARTALGKIGRTLKAAGMDWGHLVEGIVYLKDMSRAAAVTEAYGEVFSRDFPARTMVGTELVNPDGLVEIMFTGVRD